MKTRPTFALLALASLAAAAPEPAMAQLGRIRERVKERVEEEVERRTRRPPDTPPAEGATPAPPASPGASPADPRARGAAGADAAEPGGPALVRAASDFVPGPRALFEDDFSGDRPGDFPRGLQLERGNLDLVEWQRRRFLRASSEFQLRIPLPETLPERFTLEFDMSGDGTTYSDALVKLDFGEGGTADHVVCGPFMGGIYGRGGFDRKAITELRSRGLGGSVIRCRVMADGASTKVYVNETRVANHPSTRLGRRSYVTLSTDRASEENPILIGGIRVGADGSGGGAARGRFRVTLNGFSVRRPTTDHALEVDGKGDEVYFVAGVLATNTSGERVKQQPKITTPVYGDANGFAQRIRAGSRSLRGGLQADDSYPEQPSARSAEPSRSALPLVLWDDEIVQGETIVYLIPSVWEYDNGAPLVRWETMWKEWTDTLTTTAKREGKRRTVHKGPGKAASKIALAVKNVAARAASMVDKTVGTAGDRPIGMKRSADGGRVAFEPQVLELTYETAEELARTDPEGSGRGVVALPFDDSSSSGGRYTLNLQVERVP